MYIALNILFLGVPVVAQWKQTWLVSMRMRVRPLVLLSVLRIQHCCELWCRPQMRLGSGIAVAVVPTIAPIQPLPWELPYAAGVALKSKEKNPCWKLLKFWTSHCGAMEMNLTRNHGVLGSVPGLDQWVKDLAFLWAVVWVADAAQIWCCCDCGVGWRLQLDP